MGLIQTVGPTALTGTFKDEDAIIFPATFEHPEAGKYKDQPEAFFLDKAVRILVDMPDGMKVPAWLDVEDFFDDVESGQRLARGKLRSTVRGYDQGVLWPFHVSEVFDFIQRVKLPAGAVGGVVATFGE